MLRQYKAGQRQGPIAWRLSDRCGSLGSARVRPRRKGAGVREELLAAVRRRTAATIKTGDSRPVLAPDALAEADALLARVLGPAANADEPPDLEVLHAVGWLYWLRGQALPSDEFDDDLEMAMMVLQPVYAADPQAVP